MRLAFYRAQMTRFFLCSALGIFFLAAPARAGVEQTAEIPTRREAEERFAAGRKTAACREEGQQLAEAWREQRSTIGKAFLGTGAPYAKDAWTGAQAALDGYTIFS